MKKIVFFAAACIIAALAALTALALDGSADRISSGGLTACLNRVEYDPLVNELSGTIELSLSGDAAHKYGDPGKYNAEYFYKKLSPSIVLESGERPLSVPGRGIRTTDGRTELITLEFHTELEGGESTAEILLDGFSKPLKVELG